MTERVLVDVVFSDVILIYLATESINMTLVSFGLLRLGGSFSVNPETILRLGPGGMHFEHDAVSAPRCRGAGVECCASMIT